MGFYTSGIISVDKQLMIHGKLQRTQLMEKHISMLGKGGWMSPSLRAPDLPRWLE
jgi:hypothetical protein